MKGGDFKVGNTVKDYKLNKLLGKGGQGQVWLANDKVALKLSKSGQQGRKMQWITDGCPYVINLVGNVGQYLKENYPTTSENQVEKLYLTPLELMGPDLKKVCNYFNDNNLVFQDKWLNSFAFYMLTALHFLNTPEEHPKNKNVLIHRDIKPENILFDLNIPNRVCLADMGLLKEKDKSCYNSNEFSGTKIWASLEQLQNKCSSPWDDLESMAYVFLYIKNDCSMLDFQITFDWFNDEIEKLRKQFVNSTDILKENFGKKYPKDYLKEDFNEYLSTNADIDLYEKLMEPIREQNRVVQKEIDDLYKISIERRILDVKKLCNKANTDNYKKLLKYIRYHQENSRDTVPSATNFIEMQNILFQNNKLIKSPPSTLKSLGKWSTEYFEYELPSLELINKINSTPELTDNTSTILVSAKSQSGSNSQKRQK